MGFQGYLWAQEENLFLRKALTLALCVVHQCSTVQSSTVECWVSYIQDFFLGGGGGGGGGDLYGIVNSRRHEKHGILGP